VTDSLLESPERFSAYQHRYLQQSEGWATKVLKFLLCTQLSKENLNHDKFKTFSFFACKQELKAIPILGEKR
jgi:hypothetical protein